MKKSPLLLTTILVASATHVSAQESNFSYSYLEISADALVFDDDIHVGNVRYSGVAGASVSGSLQFSDNVFVRLGGSYLSNDGHGTELSNSVGGLGLGAAFANGDATDLIVQAGMVTSEAEVCVRSGLCYKEDETGLALGAGVRHMATENFEIGGGISYADLGDFGDGVAVSVRGAWWFNESASLFLGTSLNDNSDVGVEFGFRYSFVR